VRKEGRAISIRALPEPGGSRGTGFRHEALVYRSDQEFLEVVVPFLGEGVAAGEPTLLAVHPRLAQQVAAALDDSEAVSFLPGEQYTSPLRTLRDNYDLVARHVAAGATRIRMVGEVPHPGTGGTWDGWERYEASINHFYAAFPLWSICAYDSRTTPAPVLTDVERTHPRITTPEGRHRPNPRYRDPATFLTDLATSQIDPLQRTPPALELVNPMPADARRALATLLPTAGLPKDQASNLTFALSEVLLNAIRHGEPPVAVRAWTGPGRVLATVHDHGAGPTDPFTGLMPGSDARGRTGLGLWLAHQLCDRVTLITGPHGFTVQLVAGTPHPPGDT
jgi:anti-sigma regulatory factor (Ser/Thr protein kinase)